MGIIIFDDINSISLDLLYKRRSLKVEGNDLSPRYVHINDIIHANMYLTIYI